MAIINNQSVDASRFVSSLLTDFKATDYDGKRSSQVALATAYRRAFHERRNASHHEILKLRRKIGVTLEQLKHLFHKLEDLNGYRRTRTFVQLELLALEINKCPN